MYLHIPAAEVLSDDVLQSHGLVWEVERDATNTRAYSRNRTACTAYANDAPVTVFRKNANR
jgi:hypothetical protein